MTKDNVNLGDERTLLVNEKFVRWPPAIFWPNDKNFSELVKNLIIHVIWS